MEFWDYRWGKRKNSNFKAGRGGWREEVLREGVRGGRRGEQEWERKRGRGRGREELHEAASLQYFIC